MTCANGGCCTRQVTDPGDDSTRSDVLVVTGGASGLGKAVVAGAVQQWPDVRVVSLDLSDSTPVAGAQHVRVDVTDEPAMRVARDRIESEFGDVRYLLANVGVQEHYASHDLPIDAWHRLLTTNLTSVLITCQVFGEGMRRRGEGSIVCMSSVAERFGFPRRLPYSVSKAGISAMVRTLAAEWAAQNVRVNAIAPGYVETPMLRAAFDAGSVDEEAVLAMSALPRLGAPAEIAAPVLFLLSAAASYITGETLFVDGGFSIKKLD